MLGSVLSNLLLVMGCCFLFGGMRHPEQKFNATSAVANLSLLFLATIALVVPTPIGLVTSWGWVNDLGVRGRPSISDYGDANLSLLVQCTIALVVPTPIGLVTSWGRGNGVGVRAESLTFRVGDADLSLISLATIAYTVPTPKGSFTSWVSGTGLGYEVQLPDRGCQPVAPPLGLVSTPVAALPDRSS